MNKLHIVTVATEVKFYMPYLIKTCEDNGIKLTILGLGKKWKGFNWKYKLVLNFLKKIDKNDIVCFIDAYDVICIRNLKELPDIFFELKNKYNCKIIVSEDKRNYSNNIFNIIINKLLDYYFSRCNDKPINSGTYIGLAGDLLEVLTNMLKLNNSSDGDDQILLTKYCKLNPNNVYIDSENDIFLAIFNYHSDIDDKLNFENGKITYKNKCPFFIHAYGETYLDNVIKKLYNDYDGNIKNAIKKNFAKKLLFRITNSVLLRNILIVLLCGWFLFVLKNYCTPKIK